jgi:hypothetical protein
MACICANELKRFLSGGCCFRETDDLPLRLATSVFNLVCALHAAADGSVVESECGLHGCLVTIWDRFFLLSGRHAPRCEPERRNLGGKASLKNRLPMPKIGWHVMITLQVGTKRYQVGTQNGFSDAPCLSAMPAPATASLGRLQTQGNGEATAGPNGNGGRTYVLYKSQGDASRRPRWGPAFAPSVRLGSSPFSGVRVLQCPTTRARNVGVNTGQYLRIWRTLQRLQAAVQPCDAVWASASKEPAGVARKSPPRDITVLGCCQMPL